MHIDYMPTILLLANVIKITINPKDRHRFPHVHVIHADKAALMSLENFKDIENSGFSEKNLKQVIKVLKDEKETLFEVWREYNE